MLKEIHYKVHRPMYHWSMLSMFGQHEGTTALAGAASVVKVNKQCDLHAETLLQSNQNPTACAQRCTTFHAQSTQRTEESIRHISQHYSIASA